MSNDSNPIEAVRARLDGGQRWAKGFLGDVDGPVCLYGAMLETGTRGALEAFFQALIAEQYPDRPEWLLRGCNGCAHIPYFNDDPGTDWPAMDAFLDKASVLWDERNSAGTP